MAVQQNKKSPSKRGMHRAHDFLTNPPLAVEATRSRLIFKAMTFDSVICPSR